MGEGRLRAAVGRLFQSARRGRLGAPVVKADPCSAYEMVTRQMVEDLAKELGEVRGRVNALLFGMAATFVAILIDIALRR